jgi:glyoxylase-like metal-dependent hydrolase (beta-lactamase superfamily II)
MPVLIPYDHDIFAIDAEYVRPRLAAIHLIHEAGRVAFFDTGTRNSLPSVEAALAELGLTAAAVDYVIPSHVHLDHAGGAGAMMAAFPSARLVVHPRGARHMADPSKLWAGTVAVYGEAEATALYGEVIPVAPVRIVEAHEGHVVSLAGRQLTVLDTPGHARHHICLHDARSGHVFAGDMFGLSYRELDVGGRMSIFPTTTPVQFDPEAMCSSIRRLLALNPGAIYLTHFGRVTDVARLGADLLRLIEAHVRIGTSCASSGAGREEALVNGLRDLVIAEKRKQGWEIADAELLKLLATDIALNARGLAVWLDSQQEDGAER